jgi:hypothetical protein
MLDSQVRDPIREGILDLAVLAQAMENDTVVVGSLYGAGRDGGRNGEDVDRFSSLGEAACEPSDGGRQATFVGRVAFGDESDPA